MSIGKVYSSTPFLRVEARTLEAPVDEGPEVDALLREVVALTTRIQQMAQPDAQVQIPEIVQGMNDPLDQVFLLSTMLGLDLEKEQALWSRRRVLQL